jgi:formiminoglutamase
MKAPLPFLISIPHGGEDIPPCVRERIALTRADILEDGDAFTREIYDFGGRVQAVVQTDTARAVIDLNRDVAQMPPDHPDGVLKTVTCYEKPVYREGRFPNSELVSRLIEEHYRPYHERLRAAAREPGLVLGLDCHSMAEQAPPIAAQAGQLRPLICLGNAYGESCPMPMAEALAACSREVLGLQGDQVTLNEPFSGGFITRTHGNNPIPWLQLEISRSLYLRPPWFDGAKWNISRDRLAKVSSMILSVLKAFHRKVTR